MFKLLGRIVSRGWPVVLFLWPMIALVMWWYAPPLDDVTTVGAGFALPKGYDTREGKDILAQGWGQEASRLIVLISSNKPLTEEDHDVIRQAFAHMGNRRKYDVVGDVMSEYTHPYLKDRFTSMDGTTTLCVVALKSEFITPPTFDYVFAIEEYLDRLVEKHPNLRYHLTDSAVIGRDYGMAVVTSLERTRLTTILLVMTILLLLYRSPVTWVVPLSTIALSLSVSSSVLALMAGSDIEIPKLVPIYMVVILFGSCTDYCLFLIGRFREELALGHNRFDAARIAVTYVGGAVAASAGTTIAGLCMMVFAHFDIIRQTGPALGIGLATGLICSLTFAPALMVLMGRHLFWPRRAVLVNIEKTRSGQFWDRFARLVIDRPGLVLTIALLSFLPLAVVGGTNEPAYDIFAELPPDAPAATGRNFIRSEYDNSSQPEQLVLVMRSSEVDFKSHEGLRLLRQISRTIAARPDVIEVRSATYPMGHPQPMLEAYLNQPHSALSYVQAWPVLSQALPRYVAKGGEITRVNFLLNYDTFSPQAIGMGEVLRPIVREVLNKAGARNVEVRFAGVSAHMHDIGIITRRDLGRLRWMVLAVLYIILAVKLRSAIAPVYLLATMVVNYFAALGLTHLLFVKLDLWGAAVPGLDWKVEFFLFVLLVAIGVDYNIYIMSRIREELRKRPFREALRRAIVFTGTIISSCGIIMAGTFGSMMRSTLTVMVEIGMAMAIGVLLDTFIVRPLVVPAFALLVEKVKERLRRKPAAS